jgi:heme/copper-type cytochrome/quinol oxidase subunit 1
MNRAQRIVMVVGLGVALYFAGGWITTRGTGAQFGWVAYAPLSSTYNAPDLHGGLHPWVRLVIWLVLIGVWVIASLLLLRSLSDSREGGEEARE